MMEIRISEDDIALWKNRTNDRLSLLRTRFPLAIKELEEQQYYNYHKLETQPAYHLGEVAAMHYLLEIGYEHVFYLEPSDLSSKRHENVREAIKEMVTEQALAFFNQKRTGYPDLLAIKEGKVAFFEVKCQFTHDHVRNSQKTVHGELRKLGFDCEVIHVNKR